MLLQAALVQIAFVTAIENAVEVAASFGLLMDLQMLF